MSALSFISVPFAYSSQCVDFSFSFVIIIINPSTIYRWFNVTLTAIKLINNAYIYAFLDMNSA